MAMVFSSLIVIRVKLEQIFLIMLSYGIHVFLLSISLSGDETSLLCGVIAKFFEF